MKNLFALLLLIFISTIGAFAQTQEIGGSVEFSNDTNPAIGVVVIVNESDSLSINKSGRVVSTDTEGKFKVRTTDSTVVLTLRYMGYYDLIVQVPQGDIVDLGQLTLIADAQRVEAVVVAGQASMSVVKGDTIQFNAAAFKTHPDATAEDLLLKLPGVTTDTDGNIQSQGETIQKVYVNGKEFFEDDPSLALKSLSSDAIESIQVYEDKSEDAKFSGFDDGTRIKSVNIVTKQGFMDTSSGRFSAGYGTDNRYAAGGQVNRFGTTHSFTLIGQANNVNKRDFTPRDIGASGRGRGSSGTDLSGFSTNSRGGITETYLIGGNYSGDFKKAKLNATYFYGGMNSDSWRNTDQNYLTTDRQYISENQWNGFTNSHSFNGSLEWNPTEVDKINFKTNMSYENNFGTSAMISSTYVDSRLLNNSDSDYETMLERMNGSMNLWWSHRFKKAGRTLSVGGVLTGSLDSGDRTQYSLYTTVDDLAAAGLPVIDTIDLWAIVNGEAYSYKASATYSEPISQNSQIQANYAIQYSRSISDNQGFDYDYLQQLYNLQDTTTTNYLTSGYLTHTAGLGYNLVSGKFLRLNATFNYQHATTENRQITPIYDNVPQDVKYSFNAFLPSVNLNIKPSSTQNINFMYRTSSGFPSVTQLQDILNLQDPFKVSKGNPDLKQTYSHSLMLRYNLAVPQKNINFNLFSRVMSTSNYIANHRQFLTQDIIVNGVTLLKGSQYTTPVNLQGYMSAQLFSTFGFGINPLKSNMNVSFFYRYSNIPSIEDNIEYTSNANTIGGMLALTSNISEDIDFTVNYSGNVNLTNSSAGAFDRYISHSLTGKANIYFFKYFFVSADASWVNTYGTQGSYSQHYALINASLGAKFFKNRSGEVRLSVYDALSQNRSIWQSSSDNYVTTTNSQVLGRYYMVTLGFKFDTRGGSNRGDGSGSGSERSGGYYHGAGRM